VKIDPTSTSIVLRYTGTDAGEPFISGIPASDLTENDLARLASRRGDDTEKGLDQLVAELVAGPYRKTTAPAASGKSED
jgi:hypothetical protein